MCMISKFYAVHVFITFQVDSCRPTIIITKQLTINCNTINDISGVNNNSLIRHLVKINFESFLAALFGSYSQKYKYDKLKFPGSK